VLIEPANGPPGAYQYAPNQTFPRNMNKANATTYIIPVETLGDDVCLPLDFTHTNAHFIPFYSIPFQARPGFLFFILQ
jgi:hypothetical protein